MASFLKCGLARGLARILIAALVASSLPAPARASYYTRLDTRIAEDELGNRLSQTDANGHTTWFLYDKLGRQTARILPDGKRELMAYDTAGNLQTRTDFMGRTTNYSYDDNNRLLSRSYPNPQENVSFTYSPTGRRETAMDARGTTSYGYDLRDRLTSLTQPGFGPGSGAASLGYSYDGDGNRLTLTATVNGQSHTTGYTYDDAGRLDTVGDHLARTYDFDWDANGNRERLTQPNGVVTTYAYNSLNRLTSLQAQGPLGSVFGQAFTLGAVGNRERIDEADGTVRAYTYDDLYRLRSETVSRNTLLDYSRTWTYDAVGNRQTQTTAIGPAGMASPALQPGTIDYGYDTRDRLLSAVFGGSATTGYTYDDNGSLVTKSGELTLTWDGENRLVKAEKPDGTVVETVYDADGNRVRTTTTLPGQAAQVVNYLVDTSGGLSHVVAEGDAANVLTALYIRGGDDLLAVIRPDSSGSWTSRFYTADGIGSIRRLTNEAGVITDAYSSDAFGVELAQTGSDPQPYRFAGEPYDPQLQMAYHRARWMDPSTGRFTGMDPFEGLEFEPVTLHKYLYANLNPANVTDPTGLFGVATAVTVVSITLNVLAAFSVGWTIGSMIDAGYRGQLTAVAFLQGLAQIAIAVTPAKLLRTLAPGNVLAVARYLDRVGFPVKPIAGDLLLKGEIRSSVFHFVRSMFSRGITTEQVLETLWKGKTYFDRQSKAYAVFLKLEGSAQGVAVIIENGRLVTTYMTKKLTGKFVPVP
jgi:RHS repeat-associated protein